MQSADPIELVAKRLNGGVAGRGEGTGEVSIVLLLPGGAEVEVKLPGRYPVSPQVAGAMKAVPGVLGRPRRGRSHRSEGLVAASWLKISGPTASCVLPC